MDFFRAYSVSCHYVILYVVSIYCEQVVTWDLSDLCQYKVIG